MQSRNHRPTSHGSAICMRYSVTCRFVVYKVVAHNHRPSIRVHDLVFARAELRRLSARSRRICGVQSTLLERHYSSSPEDGGGIWEGMSVAATACDGIEIAAGADVPDLAIGRGQVMSWTRRDGQPRKAARVDVRVASRVMSPSSPINDVCPSCSCFSSANCSRAPIGWLRLALSPQPSLRLHFLDCSPSSLLPVLGESASESASLRPLALFSHRSFGSA